MADSPLLNIPLEVLLQITSYLTTPEYGHVRLTCKHLEASLFGAFKREFFSKRQFALMEFSIQALVDIAKSRLGPSLTHLIIHLESPPGIDSPRGIDDVSAQFNVYLTEFLNHNEFITTGTDAEMLTDAVKHLPNLETVGMRDFNSKTRSRDNTEWHSYGVPTLNARSGHPLHVPRSAHGVEYMRRHSRYTSHVFLTILRALARAVGKLASTLRNPQVHGKENTN